jgi:RNA polymerase-interacting CarD/CdnL/TRCF family regulator
MSDDRRELLEAALDQAEEGTLETPVEKEIEVNDDPIQAENEESNDSSQESDNRDEKGRFKSKSEETSSQDDPVEELELVAEAIDEVQQEEVKRPTTWKKEYVDVWEKMKDGKPLDEQEFVKFAEYANQREAEYKKGVSAYKAEADNARQLTDAINPFVPELQQQGIHPVAWINNLGRAHMVLSKAPYEQKVQLFHRLAQDYGIQLNSDSLQMPEQAYVDPYQQQLMQQLQATQQQVQQLSAIRDQEENARLNQEISRVSSNKERFPHFDMVREDMAQLLERGLAQDLESAYAKAVRMNDEAYKLEQDKLLRSASTQASKAQQVAKAKATAVSPRSVTPSGQVSKGDAKDRRSLLMANLADAEGGRV